MDSVLLMVVLVAVAQNLARLWEGTTPMNSLQVRMVLFEVTTHITPVDVLQKL